ncbi:MAG: hypothetical protein M3411_04580 [Chloroflexota bacterium]|nr:hypothetical protein [Chloroflexota bacterium]
MADTNGGETRETLGMTEEELQTYFEELLREQAEEVSEDEGTPPAKVLESPGFVAARASMSYAVQLIAANNAYITRHLLDMGLLTEAPPADPTDDEANSV